VLAAAAIAFTAVRIVDGIRGRGCVSDQRHRATGLHLADAAQAINYGNKICGEVDHGRTYRQIGAGIKADFGTQDHYVESYLIAQAVNELCPALVWHLRRSAAGDDVANSVGGER
jgi:hypothetical protein